MNAPDPTLIPDESVALADGFARRIGALSKRLQGDANNVRWAQRAAFAVSRATTQGHVCIALDALAQRYGETAGTVHTALMASGVVCDGEAAAADLLPLVIGDNCSGLAADSRITQRARAVKSLVPTLLAAAN